MISLSAIIDLHDSFNSVYGIGDNIVNYLARPKTFHNGFNFEEALRIFINRESPDRLDGIKAAPQDILIFKKRFKLIANNNDAYRIATSKNPTVEDLIAFSYMQPGWSVLYALKHYLMHHMDKAKDFTGFLPYGSAVIAFVNSLKSKPKTISSQPDYADHIYLQEISNRESLTFNMPSVEINNAMYLKGLKILSSKTI